jgi:hypothetical protein
MIPVRKDILLKLPEVFPEGWVGEIFKTSVDQVAANSLATVPLIKEYTQVAQNLIDAWYALCVEFDPKKSGTMALSLMKSLLAKDFLPKQKQILGSEFPASEEPKQSAAVGEKAAPVTAGADSTAAKPEAVQKPVPAENPATKENSEKQDKPNPE